MEHRLEQGWVKSIGVSNYGPAHLEAMREYATYMPSVNQVEFNPWLQRPHLFKATEDAGAKVMAYSPLARGHKVDDPELVAIAEKLGCTPAQVAIKFCYDSGCITIPKSSRPDRIVENLASLQVDISAEMDAIRALECDYVSGWDPTTEPLITDNLKVSNPQLLWQNLELLAIQHQGELLRLRGIDLEFLSLRWMDGSTALSQLRCYREC